MIEEGRLQDSRSWRIFSIEGSFKGSCRSC